MISVREGEPLAAHTTLKVGGPARYFVSCTSATEVREAWLYARTNGLTIAILGGGSNTLAPQEGINGLVLQLSVPGMQFDGDQAKVGAGVSWDEFVSNAASRGFWGIENLAGIPGTVGGAVVQNIGAYGEELSRTYVEARVFDLTTGEERVVSKEQAGFYYRGSVFKKESSWVILEATFSLSPNGLPNLSYPDLAQAKERGISLETPEAVGTAVRAIRAKKFPDMSQEGTAGSFFKNPQVEGVVADRLRETYPDLPQYPGEGGRTKISLAWILDHVLALRGFAHENVRLFERQPLVLVTTEGATANSVDAFASQIAAQIQEKIGITIEREVETLHVRV